MKLSYIIETTINGNPTHAKKCFQNMRIGRNGLGSQIIECAEMYGLNRTIKILNYVGLSDTNIINAFHDHSRDDLIEVKTILLNTD
jgi:hypothetical protein